MVGYYLRICATANKTHAQAHVEQQDQNSPITHKTPKVTHNKQYPEKCTTLVILPLYDQSCLKLTRPFAFLPRNALRSPLSILHDLHAIFPTPTFAAHRELYLDR